MNPNPPGTPSEEDIAQRARALWKADGQPEGQDLAFWLNAENKLRDELAAEYDQYCALLERNRAERRLPPEVIPTSQPVEPAGGEDPEIPFPQPTPA